MIDHVTLKVKDLAKSKEFYKKLLESLGYSIYKEFPGVIGFQSGGRPDFWVGEEPDSISGHVAFATNDHAVVDAFHAAGLAAGGTDNGEPGPREYGMHYYAAYIHDPEGNNIEAVCHDESH